MKIRFTGEFSVPDDALPDDRGTVDHWVARELAEVANLDTDDAFNKLNLKWKEVRPRGRPRKVKQA